MVYAVTFPVVLQIYLVFSLVVVAFEDSGHYVEATAVTVVVGLVLVYVMALPGLGGIRLAERWAAGQEVDRARALDATYSWARGLAARLVGGCAVGAALLLVVVGVIAGADGSRLVQYGIVGAVIGPASLLPGVHSFVEAALRPAS